MCNEILDLLFALDFFFHGKNHNYAVEKQIL